MTRAAPRLVAVALVAILLEACGSTSDSPSPAASTPVSTDTPSASPSAAPPTTAAPSATSDGGPLEIRGGTLEPGTYTRSGFQPRIIFDIGEGWHGVQNLRGFFDVQQDPDTPDVIAVQFGNAQAVFGADGARVPLEQAADAVPVVQQNPGLEVIEQGPFSMSGLEGFTVVVENADEGDVQVLEVPAGALAISPGRRLWVSFVDTLDGVLAVMVGGSVARWDDTLAIAQPVLESVRIGDAAP